MVKAYLKYDYMLSLGLLNQSANTLHQVDNYILTAANEYLLVINLKTKEVMKRLKKEVQEGEGSDQVSCIQMGSLDQQMVAVGYSSGEVVIFDIEKECVVLEVNEHSSAVNSLRFSVDEQYLFTGGADTDIYVIDLVQQKSLFKLQGHSNQVTALVHLQTLYQHNTYDLLCSSAKDGMLKIWDLTLNQQVAAISTNSIELYTILQYSSDVIVLFTQNSLSFYRIHVHRDTNDVQQYYSSLGVFKRTQYTKVIQSQLTNDGYLYLLTHDNSIEVYQVLDKSLVIKKMKRKNQRENNKKKEEEGDDFDKEAWVKEVQNNIQYIRSYQLGEKVKGFKVNKKELTVSFDKKGIIIYLLGGETLVEKNDLGILAHQEQILQLDISSDDNLCLSLSKDQVKIWHIDPSHPFQQKGQLLSEHSMKVGKFLPKGRFIVVGDSRGAIGLYDLRSMSQIDIVQLHSKTVNSIDFHSKPDGAQGIVILSGSADQSIVFSQLSLTADNSLGLRKVKSISLGEDVLSVRYFPNGKYYAVSLLDLSIRIFYSDSDKEYLSLYGHKLAVHCMDISSDCTLLASGSNDKNIRLWGLDYGDCKKSIFAHNGAVSSLSFIRDTHYLLSTGKDGVSKHWDGDTYEQTQEFNHDLQHSQSIAVTNTGDYFVQAGKDRVVRVYKQGSQQVFPQELQEQKQEQLMMEEDSKNKTNRQEEEGKYKAQNMKYGEEVMEAFDLLAQVQQDKDNNDTSITAKGNLIQLGGKTADQYILQTLKAIRYSELENSLKFVHMTYIQQIVNLLEKWVASKTELELCTRILVFILQKDENYLVHSKDTLNSLHNIQALLRTHLNTMHSQMHFNHQGLRLLFKEIETQKQAKQFMNQTKEFSFI